MFWSSLCHLWNSIWSLRRAKAYKARADELRAVSEWMNDPSPRTQLVAMADSYEHMADMIEKFPAFAALQPFDKKSEKRT